MKLLFKFLLVIVCLSFIQCKKKGTDDPKPVQDNTKWEIYKDLKMPSAHYIKGSLLVVNDKVYASLQRDNGVGNTISSFLFENASGWQNYEKTGENFVALKYFNNTIFGILEHAVPYMAGQVQSYKYNYYLYRWSQTAFENIAKLDHTDQNGQKETVLQQPLLWVYNNQLYFVALVGNAVAKQWHVGSGSFKDQKEIGNTSSSQVIIASDNWISFMRNIQKYNTNDITDNVQWLYYNGQSLSAGPVHSFIKTHDGYVDNTYNYYVAIQNNLFGFLPKTLTNLDNKQEITALKNEGVFSKMSPSNGHIISMLTDERGNCSEIMFFNGKDIVRKPYILPASLDKCSNILDTYTVNGKTYLLIASNRQVYVLKEK